ncbi:MAG: aminotransferase class I/II-fold pyridoxal phosphate-dependent enzyme [Candidatus Nitrosotenuis sp.]
MKPKLGFVADILDELKKENLYRRMRYGKINGPYITIGRKKLVNFCSNDYLGLSVLKALPRQFQSSSRLVSGNDVSFMKLERILASRKSQESSLIFPTGYMANLGTIPALAAKDSLILSDELNHASIIEACRLSSSKTLIYKHNDVDDLSKKIRANKKARKFIITEGIFSMDGDLADLKRISELAEKNNAILILDDAHGDFTIGKDGRGSANHFGVEKNVDVYTSSLSKGLGSFGGYAATSKEVVDLCVNKAKSFIYTSALPSFLVDLTLERLKQNREMRRKKLEQNVELLSTQLRKLGYDIQSQTHIIPLIIGDERRTLDFGRYLYERGVFAQPIRYPTVPKNSARIRISVTAWLSKNHIEYALGVFEKAGKKFGIL